MEINESLINAALDSTLTGEKPVVSGGGVSEEEIEKARRMSLGESPAEVARLGSGTAGYNLRPDKYDFQMRTRANNEELRANGFSGLKSFGNGLGKLVTNTLGDIAGAASSIFVGIPSAIANGDANQLFDNGVSEAITEAQNWAGEELFPIYNSVKDKDKNILHRALTDLEFWTDDVLGEGVPFILSAYLTGYAGAAALRPLTKAKYLKQIQAAKGLGAEATASLAKTLQSQEQLAASFLARTVEGMVEAKDTRDQVYDKLIAKGLSPEEATAEAGKAAMATFGLNYLLMPVEYLQAGSWFKSFGKSRDQLLNVTKKVLVEVPKRYTLNKAAKDVGVNMITEGPIEENFQKAVQDYVYGRFTGNDRDEIRPWEDEISEGINGLFSKMGENFTTKEGWDAIGTGSILGGLFGGAATAFGSGTKTEKQRLQAAASEINMFNDNKEKVDERVNNIISNIKSFDELDKLSKVQQLKNNEAGWNIFETLKFGEYAFAHFDAGLGARLEQQINEAEQASEEDFISGFKDKNKVGELKQKLERYEKLYNMVSERFNLSDDKAGRHVKQSLYREAILQEELQKEIEKAKPEVESLLALTTNDSAAKRLTHDANMLVKANKALEKNIADIKNTEDATWYKLHGHALTKKLEKQIFNNSREIAKLRSERDLMEKEDPGLKKRGFGTLRNSKVAKDMLNVAEKQLLDLTQAYEISLDRYDLLADPSTQKQMDTLLVAAETVNKDKAAQIKEATELAKKQDLAAQVAEKTGKPVDKVLSTTPQKNDKVIATVVKDGKETQVSGTLQKDGKVVSNGEILTPTAVVTEAKPAEEENYDWVVGAFEDAKEKEEKVKTDEPLDQPTVNPDDAFSEEEYLFTERKKKTNEYSLAGKDIDSRQVGDEHIDRYDTKGNLVRTEQSEFYNYVNDPDVDLNGVVTTVKLIEGKNSDDAHIRITLPNGLETSIHTVEWIKNNIANITPERVAEYAKWRKQLFDLLTSGKQVKLTLATKGNGILLRNEKVGTKRGRRLLSQVFSNTNKLPIGITIKSKKGEEHVTRLFDWKGAASPAAAELYGYGRSGGVYFGVPSANGTLTPVPAWSRNLSEDEAKLVIAAVRMRLQGKEYTNIPGTSWTYNDLIRFYIYPSSTSKATDMFISNRDKTIRVGEHTYTIYDIATDFPQSLIADLMGKSHQVQSKRLSINEEVPVFSLQGGNIIVSDYVKYRDYLTNSVLETDVQPITVGDRQLFFAQPVINYNSQSIFTKETIVTEVKGDNKDLQSDINDILYGGEEDFFGDAAFKTVLTAPVQQQIVTEKELEWYRKNMPNIPIEIVPDLIRIESLGGMYAVGMFHKGLVTLYENAPEGTLYHEAFHAVYRMMLTEAERKSLGIEEEKLAELFEGYMLSDGTMEVPGKAKNFFARLWQLIKQFVLGTTDIYTVFKRTRDGYYQTYDVDPSKAKGIAPKAYNLTPSEEVDVMNYMTRIIFSKMFSNLEKFDNTSIDTIGTTNQDILNIYNDIKVRFQAIADKSKGNFKAKYQHIVDKYEELVKSHQLWMEKYKIVISDIEANPEEENLKLKDSFNYKEPTEFSAKDNANFMVKLFIAALPKYTVNEDGSIEKFKSELGFESVVDYNTTWSFLLEKLSGVSSDIEIIERLKPFENIKPEVSTIIKLLSNPGTFTQELFKGQFVQAFSKVNTNPVTTFYSYDKQGRLIANTILADSQDFRSIVKSGWQANFINSDLVEVDPLSKVDERITKNPEIEKIAKEQFDKIKKSKDDVNVIKNALAEFGIVFTNGAVELWVKENSSGKFASAAKYLLTRLLDPNFKDKFKLFTYDETGGEASNLNLLADIEAQYNPSIFEAVHLNPENKPTYHHIQHSFLSRMLADINNGDTEYVNKILNSFYGANSTWAEQIKNGVKPTLALLEGIRVDGEEGKITTKMTPGMWTATRINNLLSEKPIFPILRPAEKKSEYGLQGFSLIKSGVVTSGVTAIDLTNKALIDQFLGYFEDEYKRTVYANLKQAKRDGQLIPQQLLNYLQLADESEISIDTLAPFDVKGKNLTFFGPILSKYNPDLLEDLMNFHTPTKDEISSIKVALKQYLIDQINNTFDYLNDKSVIRLTDSKKIYRNSRTDAYASVKNQATNLNIENVAIGKKQLDLYNGDIVTAVADFTINEMMSTFELIKLTMGDPAFYKDFFKRTPLVTGTGKILLNTKGITDYLQAEYGKLRSKYPLTKSKQEVTNGDINLAVVKSVKKNSSQINEFREQLKKLKLSDTEIESLLEGYKGYDESDAFSWITPQAAREVLVRTTDWNPDLESIYNNIVNGNQVSYKELKNFMTAMKLMGAGPIDINDNHVLPIAYLKTSTLPLIPSMIKGRELENLLERMYESGTDMLIVDSGSKGASYSVDELYDEQGRIRSSKFTNAKFNVKHLKLQIDVQQKAKTKVVFGTQLRKLMFSHVFEYDKNGKLINKKFNVEGKEYSTKELWKKFNKDYASLTQKYKDRILNELGIEFDFTNETYKIKNWNKTVEKLRSEAASRNYPKSVIESIKVSSDGKGLDIPGDALVNRKSIENLLNAVIFNTVVSQKMSGGSFVQIPVTGFEVKGKIKSVTDSTGELKFISYDEKAGQVMEAEIYLPHSFRSKGYLNDLKIEDVDDKLLEMIGFRIPTEGLRSIIKLKVKGFLPPEAGQVVVVPSELVAQAGSDFDIDKLNIMMRHYKINSDYENSKIIPVESGTDSIEALENSIFDMTWGLLSHKDAFVPSLRTTGQTVEYMKKLAEELKAKKKDTSSVEDDPLAIIEFAKKMEIAYKFIAGKTGVGVAAKHNTHHVLTKAANLVLTDTATSMLGFKFNKIDGKAVLSGKFDSNGINEIADVLAASVNGFVDIVKNPFIIDLFTDTNTAGIALTLLRLGAPLEWAVNYINQPLIQRYIKSTEFARSEIGKLTETSIKEVKNKLFAYYYSKLDKASKALVDTSTWTLNTPMFKNTTADQLSKYIDIAYSNGEVLDQESDIANNKYDISNNEFYLSQIALLGDFFNYETISNKLRVLDTMSSADTAHAKTFNDVDRLYRIKEQVFIDQKVENVGNFFENYQDLFFDGEDPTFIQSFYENGTKLEHQAFREIFPIRQSDQVQNAVRRVESLIGRTNQLRDYDIERLSDSLMGYLMYGGLNKEEMKNFVLDEYKTPQNRLLVSTAIKYNLMRGEIPGIIKRGEVFKVKDKLNLNGVYSVEITKVTKTTREELIKVYDKKAFVMGAGFLKPKTPVYLYETRLIKNDLVKSSTIRDIHDIKSKPANSSWKQELKDNLLFDNLRVFFSRKANGVNSLRFKVRPGNNVAHEDLTEAWRDMFNSGHPEVRDLALKLAKYAIYQSGMKQTNISFWRYIPSEEFSKIVNNSLEVSGDIELDSPEVLNIIFRNLYNNDTYVPQIRNESQLTFIRNEKNDVIGYQLKKNSAANARFYDNGVPPFLKFRTPVNTLLMELVGFSGERQTGDAIYQVTSKLGDGLLLSEYHSGASIYEDNNEYIEDPNEILKYVNSSEVFWKATTPISAPVVLPENIAPKADNYNDVESESNDDHSITSENSVSDVPDINLDDFDEEGWSVSSGKLQLTPQDSRLPDENLNKLLTAKLAEIGVSVEDVAQINTKFGSAIAVAKALEGVIQVAKGKADITTLPEEAAHIFVAMLDPNSPLLAKMMREITGYEIYKTVVAEYSEVYNNDETKLKLETIGKLIGKIIVNDFTGEKADNMSKAKGWWDRVWDIIKKILSKIGVSELQEYTRNSPSIFKQFAMDITTKKQSKSLSEAIVFNNFDSIVLQLKESKYLTKTCK